MILYRDSSALVKLFVVDEGSREVHAAVGDAADCYTHLIAYAEVGAALARALRVGRETPERRELHKRELAEMWQALAIVVPNEAMDRRCPGTSRSPRRATSFRS